MTQSAVDALLAIAAMSAPALMLLLLLAHGAWRRSREALRVVSRELDEANATARAGDALLDENNRLKERLESYENRFTPILNVDTEVEKLRSQAETVLSNVDQLRRSYSEKKLVYDRLVEQVAAFDERLAFAELGVYEPHFEYTDSEAYKHAIVTLRERQKGLIAEKRAVICTKQWTVDGSVSAGQTMTNRNINLTLRAFNNECEAAIANVRWNNANAMEKRIISAQKSIDKLNASTATMITDEFRDMKLLELRLTHEHREKLKAERDERAELARVAKEEQRLLREMERAEEEEDRYERMLQKARAEAESVVGPRLNAFAEQIEVLERDLAEAHAKVERARSLAERTRSGYIYIVSNIGSFGDEVVKIGLTRRLDPIDRVRELGDASVPFSFDTHAIVYSDDAPTLERRLHAEFEHARVNTRNYRKEFFRVSLNDVEAALVRLAPETPFFKDIEAQEYRETLARRQAALEQASAAADQSPFPATL